MVNILRSVSPPLTEVEGIEKVVKKEENVQMYQNRINHVSYMQSNVKNTLSSMLQDR